MDRNLTVEEKIVVKEKSQTAKVLANKHFEVETGLTKVYRASGSADVEFNRNEPIKLLEVNEFTVPSGVMPLRFGPAPASGIHYASVIVEVTPQEYEKIQQNQLSLPKGWSNLEELPRPPAMAGGD